MHKDYYCAYHHTQIITAFCRCSECLLPTCSTCIALHTEQHTINSTAPQYENITTIFKQIFNELQDTEKKAKSLARSLVFIQRNRKQEMNDLRNAITKKGNQIIQQFRIQLKKVEKKIIQVINQMDVEFIREIEGIDEGVLRLERDVGREIAGMQSQESLKTVISYYQGEKREEFEKRIMMLTDTIEKFGAKKIYVKFISDFNTKIEAILKDFISITQMITHMGVQK